MKSLEEQLTTYAAYHRDSTNKAIHAVFVPLITWSAMGLLSFSLPVHVEGFDITLALVVSALVLLYYLALDFALGVVMVVLFSFLLVTASQVHAAAPSYGYAFFGIVFAVSWIGQILGHSVWEHRKPALLDNLFQVLIAPLFVVSEGFFVLGLRKDLKERIEGKMPARSS